MKYSALHVGHFAWQNMANQVHKDRNGTHRSLVSMNKASEIPVSQLNSKFIPSTYQLQAAQENLVL